MLGEDTSEDALADLKRDRSSMASTSTPSSDLRGVPKVRKGSDSGTLAGFKPGITEDPHAMFVTPSSADDLMTTHGAAAPAAHHRAKRVSPADIPVDGTPDHSPWGSDDFTPEAAEDPRMGKPIGAKAELQPSPRDRTQSENDRWLYKNFLYKKLLQRAL